jgi:hypothetical protein
LRIRFAIFCILQIALLDRPKEFYSEIAIQIPLAAVISLNILDYRSPSLQCGEKIAPPTVSPYK